MKRRIIALVLAVMLIGLLFTACGKAKGVSDEYAAQTITIEGLESGSKTYTIGQLREFEMHDLDASYKRTTGLYEEFKMKGVYFTDLFADVGIDPLDYEGIGVVGTDGYYCLIPREVTEVTPDLMLALEVDGEPELDEGLAPAWLAVQGQFGPYWVKMVEKIILYEEVPKKKIESVWVFKNLANDIEPYMYEYYGSKDESYDLEQIWARLDNVNTEAFFTMKSSDGFYKTEAMNMVLKRYYLKTEGQDAPTNISPHIALGMNVQHISWCSSNADAMLFPKELVKYMTTREIGGQTGIPLDEVLYEVQVERLKGVTFEIIGMDGSSVEIVGEDLEKGILVPETNDIVFDEGSGYENVANMLRIRIIDEGEPVAEETEEAAPVELADIPAGDGDAAVLSIKGDGVAREAELSLSQLKAMTDGYVEEVYSVRNNWPTEKESVAKGVDLEYLLKNVAGMTADAKLITITSTDGFLARFTPEQLFEGRYQFVNGEKAEETSAVLAWEYAESADLNEAEEGKLRTYYGQLSLTDCNTIGSVQDVASIEVVTEDPGKWDQPFYEITDGGTKGKQITISYEYLDAVKVYYTTDGSEPGIESALYNPSTTYFQPELIVPIEAAPGDTVKVIICGNGKADSDILEIAV